MMRSGSVFTPFQFRRLFIVMATLGVLALVVGLVGPSAAAADDDSRDRMGRPVFAQARVVRSLPEPHAEVRIDDQPYLLADGQFYVEVRRGREIFYAPVQPKYGSRMQGMPTQWRVLMVHGQTYYRSGPHFFKRIDTNGAAIFELQKPPIGVKIDGVPPGHRRIKGGDAIYYSADGVYYQRVEENDGATFQVVGSPG